VGGEWGGWVWLGVRVVSPFVYLDGSVCCHLLAMVCCVLWGGAITPAGRRAYGIFTNDMNQALCGGGLWCLGFANFHST